MINKYRFLYDEAKLAINSSKKNLLLYFFVQKAKNIYLSHFSPYSMVFSK